MKKFTKYIVGFAIAAISSPLLVSNIAEAHHSFRALYDYEKDITILGTVSQIDFVNPHVHFNVDVVEDGKTNTYRIETMQANLARSYDFEADSMAVGDPVEVTAWVGHTNEFALGGQELVLKDGTVFKLRTVGASPGNPNNRPLFGFIGETRSPSPQERFEALGLDSTVGAAQSGGDDGAPKSYAGIVTLVLALFLGLGILLKRRKKS